MSEKSIVPKKILPAPSVLVIILSTFVELIRLSGANKIIVTRLMDSIVPIEKETRNIIPSKKLLWLGSNVIISAPVPAKPCRMPIKNDLGLINGIKLKK